MTVKTPIDVEALVQWTYQVQQADVIIGAGVGLYESEALVDRVGWYSVGRMDSCRAVRRAGLLGVIVDSGSPGRGELHPDAEAVHEAVMMLTLNDRGAGLLVLQFGVAGLQPDWREGAHPRWEPCETRQRPNGDWVPIYQYKRGAGIGKRPWFCPMRMIDAPESIAFARRTYDAWWGGLVALARVFTANHDLLYAHTVTGPAVPATPWNPQGITA